MKKYIILIGLSLTLCTNANATECKRYNTVITIDGQQQQAYGITCLQPDGSWALQNNSLSVKQEPTTVYVEKTPPTIIYTENYYRPYRRPQYRSDFYYGYNYPLNFRINIGNHHRKKPHYRRPHRRKPHRRRR